MHVRPVLAAIALLMVLQPVAAGPGHDGPTPIKETMYVHFTESGLLLNPGAPDAAVLSEPESVAPACATSQAWQAVFSRDGSGTATPLTRDAEFEASRPRLTWYLQTFAPGTATPSPVPLQDVTLDVAIRTGHDLDKLGDGTTLAFARETITPADTEMDGIYLLESSLSWTDESSLPGNETLQLEVVASFGIEGCETSMPGVRAYADDAMRPGIQWALFDPIRIDALTAEPRNGSALIRLEASSPWGSEHFAAPAPPAIKGGTGSAPAASLSSVEGEEMLVATWLWEQGSAANGTYSAEISIQDRNGATTATERVLFKMGGVGAPTAVDEQAPPEQKSPGLVAPSVAALLAILAITKKRRAR